MKITKILLLTLLSCQFAFAQQKSQSSPIEFQGKSINSYSIRVAQSLSFVSPLFSSKFDLEELENEPTKKGRFVSYFQVKMPKISSGFLDFYYGLEETQTDIGSFVSITLLVSKGYDNFVSPNSDMVVSDKILELLDEIGASVERKNIEIQIIAKEKLMQAEKDKLLFIEQELKVLENEKTEINSKIIAKSKILADQSRIAEIMGNDLQKLRFSLSSFEKKTNNKSKSTLKVISKQ
jgi:hypothetical protein